MRERRRSPRVSEALLTSCVHYLNHFTTYATDITTDITYLSAALLTLFTLLRPLYYLHY